jgi:hypothetical protein
LSGKPTEALSYLLIILRNGFYASSVRERGDVTTLPLLAEQFVDGGFVDAKQFRNFPLGFVSPFYRLNDALSQF